MGTAALLIIDMQAGLVTGAHAEHQVLDSVNSLIRKARAADRPVVFVQHNHAHFRPLMKGASGWQIHPALDVHDDDILIEKTASDAFYATDLEEQLRKREISVVVVAGMQTEYCVDATCRAALSHDFDVVLVADGHTTGSSHLSAEEIINHHNVVLTNVVHPNAELRTINAGEISFESE